MAEMQLPYATVDVLIRLLCFHPALLPTPQPVLGTWFLIIFIHPQSSAASGSGIELADYVA